jgi:hypothetical protein
MERGKHASYASQRIPVMQLMAKVSTFTGQRKEEHDARIRDFSATTGDIKVNQSFVDVEISLCTL